MSKRGHAVHCFPRLFVVFFAPHRRSNGALAVFNAFEPILSCKRPFFFSFFQLFVAGFVGPPVFRHRFHCIQEKYNMSSREFAAIFFAAREDRSCLISFVSLRSPDMPLLSLQPMLGLHLVSTAATAETDVVQFFL